MPSTSPPAAISTPSPRAPDFDEMLISPPLPALPLLPMVPHVPAAAGLFLRIAAGPGRCRRNGQACRRPPRSRPGRTCRRLPPSVILPSPPEPLLPMVPPLSTTASSAASDPAAPPFAADCVIVRDRSTTCAAIESTVIPSTWRSATVTVPGMTSDLATIAGGASVLATCPAVAAVAVAAAVAAVTGGALIARNDGPAPGTDAYRCCRRWPRSHRSVRRPSPVPRS